MDPTSLERAILEAVARVKVDEPVPFSLGSLGNLIREKEAAAGNASFTELVDAIVALEATGAVNITKYQGSHPVPVPYSREKAQENLYRNFYFGRGDFRLRLTHEGRKRLGRIEKHLSDALGPADEHDDRLPLYRRKIFDSDAQRFADEAIVNSEPLSLLMADLDRFKQVNDQHGHVVGDEVLLECSQLMQKRAKGKGKAYRYGGEEFAVLLPNFAVAEGVVLAEELRRAVESSPLSGRKLRMTVSVGVACVPDHAKDAPGLIARADEALLRAKRLGRNLVRVSGEPETTIDSARKMERRQPDVGVLSDEEQEAIRRTWFSGYEPECPRDGSLLRVFERHEMGFRTPHLRAQCPLCGLDQLILGLKV